MKMVKMMIINLIINLIMFYLFIMLASGIISIYFRIKNKDFPKSLTRCYCDNCKHELKFWESSFPIFNYFILKGKCKYCGFILLNLTYYELTLGLYLFIVWRLSIC